MEGYGSVCLRVSLAPLFLFNLKKRQKENGESKRHRYVIVMSLTVVAPPQSSINDVKKTENKTTKMGNKEVLRSTETSPLHMFGLQPESASKSNAKPLKPNPKPTNPQLILHFSDHKILISTRE